MKKLFSILLYALLAVPMSQADDVTTHDNTMRMVVGSFEDKSNVSITLYLHTPTIATTAFEACIVLPEGATFKNNDAGIATTLNSSAVAATHTATEGNPNADNKSLYSSVASPELETIATTNETAVASWVCDFSSLADGEYTIQANDMMAVAVVDGEVKAYYVDNQEYAFTIYNGKPTGIEQTIADTELRPAEIYNLQGMKVNNATPGNIYIINGKKTIIK